MPKDRQIAIDLIDEAVTAGARCGRACAVLEINVRTLQRWRKALQESANLVDRRKAENRLAIALNLVLERW